MVRLTSWPEAKSKVPSPRADFPLARGRGNPRAELPLPHRGSQRPGHGRELLGPPAAGGVPGRRRAEGTRGAGLGPAEDGERRKELGRGGAGPEAPEGGRGDTFTSGYQAVSLSSCSGERVKAGGTVEGGSQETGEVGAWCAGQA